MVFLCRFIIISDPYRVTHGHLIHCWGKVLISAALNPDTTTLFHSQNEYSGILQQYNYALFIEKDVDIDCPPVSALLDKV